MTRERDGAHMKIDELKRIREELQNQIREIEGTIASIQEDARARVKEAERQMQITEDLFRQKEVKYLSSFLNTNFLESFFPKKNISS